MLTEIPFPYPSVHSTVDVHMARLLYPNGSVESPAFVTAEDRFTEAFQRLGEVQWMPTWDARAKLNNIDMLGRTPQVFGRILRRILDEVPGYFHDFQELGLMPQLIEGFKDGPLADIPYVEWMSKRCIGGVGSFDEETRFIYIAKSPPRHKDILLSLLLTGDIPYGLEILKHEKIHGVQYPGDANGPVVLLPDELQEAHSYWAENQGPVTDESVITSITGAKYKGEAVYPHIDVAKLDFSVEAVMVMDALGWTHARIGRTIVNHGEWDGEVYLGIQQLVDSECRELGLSQTDLEGLTDAHFRERIIDQLRVKHIAQQEVERAARTPFFLYS